MSMSPSFVAQGIVHACGRLSPSAASFLIASVWRGALLALLVALALALLPKLSAAVRSVVWLAVLLAVLLSPALPLMSHPRPSAIAASGLVHIDPRWSYALFGIWAAASIFRFAQLAVSAWQLRRLAQRAEPIEAGETIERILRGTKRRVQLGTSSEVDRPSVVGFFRPGILLPPDLFATLSEAELEQILLHEVEHIRRRDDWTNLLQKLSLAFLPLHPVVLWLDRRLCFERELACDDGVLQATQARKSYAACLTNLAEQSILRRGVSLALGAIGSVGLPKPRSEMAKRVYRILATPEATMGRTQARIAAGSLLTAVLGCAVLLAHTPKLVSFAPQAEQTLDTANLANATHSSAYTSVPQAVLTRASAATPHVLFTKAMITSGTPSRSLGVALKAAKDGQMKRVQHRIARQSIQASGPMLRLAAWHDLDSATPHFALAMEEDSQFTYAAVPVRGGWLIVQL